MISHYALLIWVIIIKTQDSNSPYRVALFCSVSLLLTTVLLFPSPLLSAESNPLDDSEPFVIILKQKDTVLSQGIFALFSHQNNTLYLPLSELCEEIGLGIQVDFKNQRAHGFFLQEESQFSLNLQTKQVESGKKTFPILEHTVIPQDMELFVALPTINQWFENITFDFSSTSLRIEVASIPLLPATQRKLRQEKQQGLGKIELTSSNVNLPLLSSTPYQLFSPPLLDLTTRTRWDIKKSPFSSLSITGSHDLAWSNSNWYLSLDQDNLVQSFQLTFTRQDPTGKLLMPLGLTNITIGDLSLPSLPLVAQRHTGTGLSITNLKRNVTSGTMTELRGALPQGWDAELYHNDILLGATSHPIQGEYLFKEISLQPGTNTLMVALYGPQGQEKKEIEIIRLGHNQPAPGKYFFDFSTLFDNQPFLPVQQWVEPEENQDTTLEIEEESHYWQLEHLTASGRFNLGIAPGFSIALGGMSSTLSDKRYNFVTLSTTFSKLNSSVQLDYALNTQAGWAAGFRVMSRGILFQHTTFEPDFAIDAENSNHMLRHTHRITLPQFNRLLDLTLRAQYDQFIEKDSLLKLQARNKFKLANFKTSHIMEGEIDNNQQRVNGQLNLHRRKEKWGRFTSQLSYELAPKKTVKQASFKHRGALFDNTLQITTGVTHSFSSQKTLINIGLGFTANMAKIAYTLSTDLKAENIQMGLTLSFSLTPQQNSPFPYISPIPSTRTGIARIHVFEDQNNDRQYTEGEKAVPGTKLQGTSIMTDQTGQALIPVPFLDPVPLKINEESLPDPFLRPLQEGYQASVRKGQLLNVPLPVAWVSDVEGTVFITEEKTTSTSDKIEKTTRELGNVHLSVVNQQGQEVMQGRSQYDGFFSFTGIPTGHYRLRISPEQAAEFHIDDQGGIPFQIHDDTAILPGLTLQLYRLKPLASPE